MRKISAPIYISAFIATVMIFAIGIYVGSTIDRGNAEAIGDDMTRMIETVSSAQLLFLLGDSDSFCPVYAEELQKLDAETERVGLKLAYLEDIKGVYDNELKKQYFVLETNAFLLSKKVRETCGGNFTTMLYFYSNANCTDCRQQGYELINLKQKLGESVRIYSFDGTLGSTLVDALESEYRITSYPSIVIENNTIRGFRNANAVEAIVGN